MALQKLCGLPSKIPCKRIPLNTDILEKVLRNLELEDDYLLNEFKPLECDQRQLKVPDGPAMSFEEFKDSQSAIGHTYHDRVGTLSPHEKTLVAPIADQLTGARQTVDTFFCDKSSPVINPWWHVDFQNQLKDTHSNDNGYVLTLLPDDGDDKGSNAQLTTRYIKFDGTIEIPHFVGTPKFDTLKYLRNRLTHEYVTELIDHEKLTVANVPVGKWVVASRCFLHSSPPYDSANARERGFMLVRDIEPKQSMAGKTAGHKTSMTYN